MDADIAPSWPHATDASQLAGCKREELQDLAREAEMPESEIALFTNHTMKREKFVAMLLKAQADTAVREATRQRLTLKTSLCFYCEGVKEMKVRDAKVTCPVCDGDGMVLPEQVEMNYALNAKSLGEFRTALTILERVLPGLREKLGKVHQQVAIAEETVEKLYRISNW